MGPQTMCNKVNELPTWSRGENDPRNWITYDFENKTNMGCLKLTLVFHYFLNTFVTLQLKTNKNKRSRECSLNTINCIDGLPVVITVCQKLAKWSRREIKSNPKGNNTPFFKLNQVLLALTVLPLLFKDFQFKTNKDSVMLYYSNVRGSAFSPKLNLLLHHTK